MNKQVAYYFLVGLFSVVSIVALVASALFLRGRLNKTRHYTIIFNNALGLQQGENVQMSGVKIGTVDTVGLRPDHKAIVQIGIEEKFIVPTGSQFAVASPLLFGTRFLNVLPNPNPSAPQMPNDSIIVGVDKQPIDATIDQANRLLKQGETFAKESEALVVTLRRNIEDPARQKALNRTIDNTAQITDDLKQVTKTLPQLRSQLDGILADLKQTTGSAKKAAGGVDQIVADAKGLTQNANSLITDVRGVTGEGKKIAQNVNATINENRKTIKQLIESADEAAAGIAGLTTTLKDTLSDTKLRDNLNKTTGNLAAITAKLDATAADLNKITGDPKFASDIRDTVGNIRETTTSLRNLLSRVETIRIPGEQRPPAPETTPANGGGMAPAPPRPAITLPESGFAFDAMYDTKGERFQSDALYTLFMGKRGTFYRVGLGDFTYGNRLMLERGQAVPGPVPFDYRYGILYGKLGAGLDFRTGFLDWRVDFFDPNRFTTNVRLKANLSKNAAIIGGMDSVGRENKAIIGLRVRP
jgi:phospholipid/cholesterol/gamma-HCH transport system substrate-binding protein